MKKTLHKPRPPNREEARLVNSNDTQAKAKMPCADPKILLSL